ncbi:lactonase family protein [Microvirga aerophila]|uniref:6-phosphogluconolactonase n=1 Tax=Microvirga aerophila TaxID=670291 RepID=A0A512C266_9HYPH|nr:lactonase family protein [Microvirga aerophila]GEO18310.1 6-phosphogluconolactonase [Microvirga aerophila]
MTTGSPFYFAYVGSRTTRERNARGDGINVYRVDAITGTWTHAQLVDGLLNPSFLALDRSGRFLYCVHGDAREISAFGIDPGTGRLTFINQETTGGRNPVHLSVDPGNRFLVVANHVTSSLAVLPRHEDGSLGKLVDLVVLEGQIGPHRVEQPFAKPHQVEFDPSGRFIAVPDKGLDCVFTFRLDEVTGKLIAVDAPPAPAREGAGPRHIVFHPGDTVAYVVNELDSTITAYGFDPERGSLTPLQVMSSLPDTFVGHSRGAEIAVSKGGRFLYASNRGHGSIAIFSVDPASRRLTNVAWQESQGRTPRFFTLDPTGTRMFVANEDSDNIVTFRVDQETGTLSHEEVSVRTGSPVCIVFATTV